MVTQTKNADVGRIAGGETRGALPILCLQASGRRGRHQGSESLQGTQGRKELTWRVVQKQTNEKPGRGVQKQTNEKPGSEIPDLLLHGLLTLSHL